MVTYTASLADMSTTKRFPRLFTVTKLKHERDLNPFCTQNRYEVFFSSCPFYTENCIAVFTRDVQLYLILMIFEKKYFKRKYYGSFLKNQLMSIRILYSERHVLPIQKTIPNENGFNRLQTFLQPFQKFRGSNVKKKDISICQYQIMSQPALTTSLKMQVPTVCLSR